jgi:hypothetical protein
MNVRNLFHSVVMMDPRGLVLPPVCPVPPVVIRNVSRYVMGGPHITLRKASVSGGYVQVTLYSNCYY